ncbi:hypothetical protein OVN20_06695 [Microcella daejeonensis]|uniref:hypothetical protein n=1 Tax=Microcella daejeonensis TaxID=2994971 RepID=UPI00226F9B77|nr:hypothetical protein [Microcella daejeonensis]WAB85228.1 hypothetical protein OVN20_06695 [Microcella daejeonensis]
MRAHARPHPPSFTSAAPRVRRRRGSAALALGLGALLLMASAAPVSAETVTTPVLTASTDEVELTLDRQIGPVSYGFGPSEWRSYLVRIVNLGDADVRVGLSVDVRQQGVLEPLWESDFLVAAGLDPADPDQAQQLADIFSPVIGPGGTFEFPVPEWPGFTYSFQQLEPVPQEIARTTSDGYYVPFYDFALDGGGMPVATVSGAEIFPGLTATVTASGLPPGAELSVWMAPGIDLFSFLLAGAQLPADAIEAGRGVVDTGGGYTATLTLPPGLPLGSYQLVIGDEASRTWPAGTSSSISVIAPPASVTATTPIGSPVVTVLESSAGTMTLTFPRVDAAGSTTVAVSSTGPTLDGFQFAGTPAVYYHLDTEASVSGQVEVCLDYDPATTSSAPRLYHYESDAWVDITTSATAGRVCGSTTSFSPFVLGVPTGVELANKEQCKDGGWRTSTIPVFGNQGSCVQWFQARGR